MSPVSLSPRRRALLDAAVEVLAAQGLRGLTHRAVDRHAGLPLGTCSAYFRTRSALQGAVAHHVTGALLEDVEQFAARLADCDGDHAAAVRLLVDLFEGWLAQRSLLVARLELTLEAGRDPDIAALLLSGRARLEDVVANALRETDPAPSAPSATTLVSALDGVLLAAALREPEERVEFLRLSIGELLDPPQEVRS